MSSFGDPTTCPVCLEKYNLKERIPRILPCIHSLCTECIGSLMTRPDYGQPQLKCPQCRKIHQVSNQGATTFQENVYIVGFIQNMSENFNGFSQCKRHARELAFYCRADSCKKPICAKGLLDEHQTHQVVDLEEEQKKRKDILQHTIDYATTAKQNMSKIKASVKTHHTQILQDIEVIRKSSKDTIDRVLNEIKTQCENQNKERTKQVSFVCDKLDEKYHTLTDISSSLANGFLPDIELIHHVHDGIAQLPFIHMKQPFKNNDDLTVRLDILKQHGSKSGPFVWCSQQNMGDILKKEVQIKIQAGHIFTLSVVLSETVRTVKQKIQAIENIPAEQQILKYGSNFMKDECTLYDHNIQHGSTLVVQTISNEGAQ